jgi:hypothetical protein
LQDDNVELDKRVIALEKECAALADRLLQEQVGRKRENEEVSALRTELTQLRKKVAVFEKQDSQVSYNNEDVVISVLFTDSQYPRNIQRIEK